MELLTPVMAGYVLGKVMVEILRKTGYPLAVVQIDF
jgi:uncharacterized protein YgiB involved in biofilm formation